MTDQSTLKWNIKEVLMRHEGRGRAITAGALAEMFGYSDDRPIRLAIEELIDDGFPVVSATEAPAGYFIPQSIEEAHQCTESLHSRGVRILLRRRKVIRNTALYLKPATQERLL